MAGSDKRFTQAFRHLMIFEGGYANDPDDTGKETFNGISRRSWPSWGGWPLVDAAKAKLGRVVKRNGRTNIDEFFDGYREMTALVRDFYFFEYWSPVARLELPARITEKIFDTSVHVGHGPAIMFLQAAVNLLDADAGLVIDGKAGKLTLEALESVLSPLAGELDLLFGYRAVQTGYYIALARKKPSQMKFINGWLKRAAWVPE